MSISQKTKSMIGFAAKSRKLLQGTASVEQGIRQRRAKLVLVADDINPGKKKAISHWCEEMEIPYMVTGTVGEYSSLLQKPSSGLLALTDEHMVSGVLAAVLKGEM